MMCFLRKKPDCFDISISEEFVPAEFIWKNVYTGAPARFQYTGCPHNEDGLHLVQDHAFYDSVIAQSCHSCSQPLACMEVPKELKKEQQMYFQWLAEVRRSHDVSVYEDMGLYGPLEEEHW